MRRYYFPLATLILLIAAVLRFWQLHIYPPGPHYDEGAYLLMTRSIAFGGAWFFPMVEAYQGREVLYMYLGAPLLHLFGDRIYTLHLLSAFLNLMAIAGSMRLAREMFPGERGRVVALVVGVVFLVSFPQLFIARQAFRAVTLPTMQVLALACLWYALNTSSRRWLLLAGVLSGAVVYTYNSSRLFPFWLLLAALTLLLTDRRHWRLRLQQGAIFFGSLMLTAAPMAVYAVVRPDVFWGRLGEVTQSDQAITLGESIVLHLRMFFIEGDPYLRYNIPHRPYFTWFEGIALVLGWGVALIRVLRPSRPGERAAYALAVLAPLMVLPSVVSISGLPPSHMRSIAMIPMAFVLVGIGAEWGLSHIKHLTGLPLYGRNGATAFAILAFVGGAAIGQSYFAWASRADLFYETDADLSLAARWLAEYIQADDRVYLAARDRSHPTVLIEPRPAITWLGTNTLYRAPAGTSGLYIFPRSAPPPDMWRAWLEPGRIVDLPMGPDGRTAFEAFRIAGDTPLPPGDVLPEARVRNRFMTLLAVYAETLVAGEEGNVVTAWQIDAAPPMPDLTPLIQVEDRLGTVLSHADVYMTDTERWEVGSVFLVRLPVQVPSITPPGGYRIRVAWVARSSDTYVPYVRASGGQGGVWATVGTVVLSPPAAYPAPDDLPITQRLNINVAPGIHLVGNDVLTARARPGESLATTLYWYAAPSTIARRAVEYEAVLRGEDADAILFQGTILADEHPPIRWTDDAVLADRERWQVPRDIASGTYELLLDFGGVEVTLSLIEIAGAPRLFDAPIVEQLVQADFAGLITLYGYSVSLEQGLHLTLVWNAQQVLEQDYTVFVHIITPDGSIAAQRDVVPMSNTYPTSLWLPGEYVVDEHVFPSVDISVEAIRIGLYTQSSGVRLAIRGDVDGDTRDYFEVLPGLD